VPIKEQGGSHIKTKIVEHEDGGGYRMRACYMCVCARALACVCVCVCMRTGKTDDSSDKGEHKERIQGRGALDTTHNVIARN
jgi:hypothetical protein